MFVCNDMTEDITVTSVSVPMWKLTVKRAIQVKVEEELKIELSKLKKVSDLASERFERKAYLSERNVYEARTTFLIRSQMLKTKWNFSSDPEFSRDLWRCAQCRSVDTQSHILFCQACKKLRESLDISNSDDVVQYYTQVMRIREETSES